jgi:hypothetical protein
MRKEKEEERNKEEHMEKMIEKINSAEDFDLLTCTQEVIDEMNKRDNSSFLFYILVWFPLVTSFPYSYPPS